MRQRWEYQVVTAEQLYELAGGSLRWLAGQEEALNVLGSEGWELVSVADKIFFFKRPVLAPNPPSLLDWARDAG